MLLYQLALLAIQVVGVQALAVVVVALVLAVTAVHLVLVLAVVVMRGQPIQQELMLRHGLPIRAAILAQQQAQSFITTITHTQAMALVAEAFLMASLVAIWVEQWQTIITQPLLLVVALLLWLAQVKAH
jgi:hypothetical protein